MPTLKTTGSDRQFDAGSRIEMAIRVRENKDKALIVREVDGKIALWCNVCQRTVNANKANTAKYLASKKHSEGMQSASAQIQEDEGLSRALTSWRKVHPILEGRTISEETDNFRMETVRYMMLAGIEISKIDKLRPFLMKHAKMSLTHSSHLRSYIPIIAKSEVDRLKDRLKNVTAVTVIFDGSTRVDEVMAVIVRYCTEDFDAIQDLIHLGKYKKLKNHQQLLHTLKMLYI
jgi:hypothetical protein